MTLTALAAKQALRPEYMDHPMDQGVGPDSGPRWTARRLTSCRAAHGRRSMDWTGGTGPDLSWTAPHRWSIASPLVVHRGTAWSIMQSNCAMDRGSCQSISARSDSDRRDDLVQILDSMCTLAILVLVYWTRICKSVSPTAASPVHLHSTAR